MVPTVSLSNNKNAGLAKYSVSHPHVFYFAPYQTRISAVLRIVRTFIYHPPLAIIWTKIFNIKKVHIVVRPPVDVVVVRYRATANTSNNTVASSRLFGWTNGTQAAGRVEVRTHAYTHKPCTHTCVHRTVRRIKENVRMPMWNRFHTVCHHRLPSHKTHCTKNAKHRQPTTYNRQPTTDTDSDPFRMMYTTMTSI